MFNENGVQVSASTVHAIQAQRDDRAMGRPNARAIRPLVHVLSRRSRVVRFRVWNTLSLVILTAYYINAAVFCIDTVKYQVVRGTSRFIKV